MNITNTTEARRGCGYRKAGGLYLCAGAPSFPCGRLPLPLGVCPTCHGGIKQSRGWTWIEPAPLFLHNYAATTCANVECQACPLDANNILISAAFRVEAGLLWVGEQFYPTTADFLREGIAQGVSRRISALPLDFVVGQTRIFFAHARACGGYDAELGEFVPGGADRGPGLFASFVATSVDYIVTDEEAAAVRSAELHPSVIARGGNLDDWHDEDLRHIAPALADVLIKLRRLERRGIRLVRPTRVDERGIVVDEKGNRTGEHTNVQHLPPISNGTPEPLAFFNDWLDRPDTVRGQQ